MGKLPADDSKTLHQYEIIAPFCRMCGLCAIECPVGAIKGKKKELARMNENKCVKCGICMEICPYDAINQVDTHGKVDV